MELKGGDKLTKALANISKKMSGSMRVGFLENSSYDDNLPVAQVAFWNEFGTSKSLPRPFMRTTIANKSGEWGERIGNAAVHYEFDAPKILTVMGETMKEDFQQSINGWTSPSNADSTIARKGFDAPLRDTMHMHDSVDYEVKE